VGRRADARNAARLDAWNERAGSNPDLLDEVGPASTTTSTPPEPSPRSTPPRRAGAGVGEAAALLGVDLD
jgi:hypothetical protein